MSKQIQKFSKTTLSGLFKAFREFQVDFTGFQEILRGSKGITGGRGSAVKIVSGSFQWEFKTLQNSIGWFQEF